MPAGSLADVTVPATLQDSLMSRLDRMDQAREVAQVGAAIGREFTYELLAAVSAIDESRLKSSLRQLSDAEIVFERSPPARFVFKHALIQDVAYQSLLRSTRQVFHARIASALEERFPDLAREQPELLGHHYSAAGKPERAIPLLRRAAEEALKKSAYAEAAGHFTRCLAEVQRLPSLEERTRLELGLQVALAVPLTATRGYSAPEVRAVYARARELCERLGDPAQMFATLYGMWRSCLLRAEYNTGLEIGAQLREIAQREGGEGFTVAAERVIASTSFYTGGYRESLDGSMRVLASHDVQHTVREAASSYEVVDSFVAGRSYAAWASWMLGRETEAVGYCAAAVDSAERLGQGFSRALALSFATWLHHFRRAPEATLKCARAALEVARDQGLGMWLGWNHVLEGWALARLGEDVDAQADRIRRGIDEWRSTGSELGMTLYLALLAEVEDLRGRPEAGLAALADAESSVARLNERFYLPEILRLRGRLLARTGESDAPALRAMDDAVISARDARSVLFELRAMATRARHTGDEVDRTALAARVRIAVAEEGVDGAASDVRAALALTDR